VIGGWVTERGVSGERKFRPLPVCRFTARMEHTYIIPVSNVCCKGRRRYAGNGMKVCTSAHHLVIQDLVQNLVYLVQLHHCTMAPYAYEWSPQC